jgi:hypothetical protein
LCARGDHRRHRVEIDTLVGSERHDVDLGTDLLGDHLPRHDVRMMLERREQDAVAGLELRPGPALRDEVDPLGRAADEDRLLGLPPMNFATRSRAASNASVMSAERWYTPRCTVA